MSPLALVVGASRGLGLRVARELLDRGHDVVVMSRSAESVERAARDLDPSGQRAHGIACDVTDADAVQAAVATVLDRFGCPDVTIHVAGVIQAGPAADMTLEHYHRAIDTMLWGPIHLSLALIPHLQQRGSGHFGVVTSVGGMVSPPHLLPYAAAKFGAVGFTDGLAAAMSGTGVSVTTIVPGLMRTGSHTAAEFVGDPVAEYSWFAPAASLPLLSVDADRAARLMVEGVLKGKPLVTITPLAWAAVRFRGLAPGTTTRLMGVATRLLPKAVPLEHSRTESGSDVAPRASRVVRLLTTLGDRAGSTAREPGRASDTPRTEG